LNYRDVAPPELGGKRRTHANRPVVRREMQFWWTWWTWWVTDPLVGAMANAIGGAWAGRRYLSSRFQRSPAAMDGRAPAVADCKVSTPTA